MGLRPGKTKGPWVGPQISSADQFKVKADSGDTVPGFLDTELVAGTGITIVSTPGGVGNNHLVISAPGSTTDEKVKASIVDTTPNYLFDKLMAGAGISVTTPVAPGDNMVTIASTAVDEKVKVTAFDTTTAYLGAKIGSGTGISIAVANPGSNEILVISAEDKLVKATVDDSTPDYLSSKLTGSGCTISTTGAAGTNQKTLITVTAAAVTKFRQFHTFTPDAVDIEGGATKTDYLSSTGSQNRFRCIELPEGSDLHFSVPMHPKYDASGITAKVHWVVIDASHNTEHSMEYNARFSRNTDTLDVNETEVAWTFQADTANDLMYIDSVASLTVEGTYNTAGTLLHFRLGHKSNCAGSGALKILAVEISYYCTLE